MISTEPEAGTIDRFEIDDELLEIFGSEAEELLNNIYASLASIISGTPATEPLWEIRRNAHTLKGAAGAVGLDAVAELAHLFEDAVDDYSHSSDPDVGLLADIAAALPLSIHQDPQQVRSRISEFRSRIGTGVGKTIGPKTESFQIGHSPVTTPLGSINPSALARVSLSKVDRCVELSLAFKSGDDRLLMQSRSLADQREELTDLVKLLTEITSSLPASTEAAKLAREFVVIENALSRSIAEMADEVKRRLSVSREMTELLGSMRFICFGMIEPRLRGAVRAAADQAGTSCNLVIENGEIEIDTVVLADMAEPIIHVLRNAAVHGIEPVEERVARGKSVDGTIKIDICLDERTYRISISDDGRGLDHEGLKRKAIENGHLTPSEASALGPAEAAELIFLEGLSTAKSLGMAAGRGVGMRIVRESVESRGGEISVSSRPGNGTKFVITLPIESQFESNGPDPNTNLENTRQKPRALLIDDSASVRYTVTTLLRDHGWDVTTAQDGRAAIEVLQSLTAMPDVIVSDLEMPRLTPAGRWSSR